MNKAYQVITDRILELLEQGIVPWRKPWKGGGEAKNLISQKGYRGVNRFLLNVANYASPFWLTFKQAQKVGGHIKKGEKSTPVVFWKLLEKENPKTGEQKNIPVLRYYRVFNLEQTRGIKAPEEEGMDAQPFTPIQRCEQLVAVMPSPPRIQHKRQAAFYNSALDLVNLPKPESFESAEEYYSTLFHELTHATGHKSRLNRPSLVEVSKFADPSYAREELVAEMGSSFLCGRTGIETATLDNSAAYINNWLKRLRNDSRLVVQAAAQAQKAADYIRGVHVTVK